MTASEELQVIEQTEQSWRFRHTGWGGIRLLIWLLLPCVLVAEAAAVTMLVAVALKFAPDDQASWFVVAIAGCLTLWILLIANRLLLVVAPFAFPQEAVVTGSNNGVTVRRRLAGIPLRKRRHAGKLSATVVPFRLGNTGVWGYSLYIETDGEPGGRRLRSLTDLLLPLMLAPSVTGPVYLFASESAARQSGEHAAEGLRELLAGS